MDGVLINDILKFSWASSPKVRSNGALDGSSPTGPPSSMCLVATGATGLGKTWTLDQVEKAFGTVYDRDYSVKRRRAGQDVVSSPEAVSVDLPATSSVRLPLIRYRTVRLDAYSLSTSMPRIWEELHLTSNKDVLALEETSLEPVHWCHVVLFDDVARHTQMLEAMGKLKTNFLRLCRRMNRSRKHQSFLETHSYVWLLTNENSLTTLPLWVSHLFPSQVVRSLEVWDDLRKRCLIHDYAASDRWSTGELETNRLLTLRNPKGINASSLLIRGSCCLGSKKENSILVEYLARAPRMKSSTTMRGTNNALLGYQDHRSRLLLLLQVFLQQCSPVGGCSSTHLGTPTQLGPVALSVRASTGILLHGPSGCGKSSMVREACAKLGAWAQQNGSLVSGNVSFQFVNAPRIFSKYLGESEANLRSIFTEARASRPCVLVVDDIDMLAATRNQGGDSSGKGAAPGLDVSVRVLSALLCEMDGVEDSTGVLVVGTTSRLQAIDKALLRQGRLETVMEIPMPRLEDKRAIVSHFLSQWGSDVCPEVPDYLMKVLGSDSNDMVEGDSHIWSSSRIELLFRNAAECGLDSSARSLANFRLPRLTVDLMERALIATE